MNMHTRIAAAVVLAASISLAAIAEEAPVEWDGLQKTKVKGIDLAYVRPGVDASAYSKIMLDPVQIDMREPVRSGFQSFENDSVTNSAEARRMVTQWANIIRSRMDAVRAHAKGQ